MRFLIILISFGSFSVMAQQETVPNQFWNHYTRINPSLAGVLYKHQGGFTYRDQWIGVSGAPKDFLVNYNCRIGEHHGVGVDANMSSIGFSKGSSVSALYSYQLLTKRKHRINFGIAPSFNSVQLPHSGWHPPTPVPDPTLPLGGRFNYLLAHTGVSFTTKSLITGFGVRNITLARSQSAQFNFEPHYYGHASLKLGLGTKSESGKHHLIIGAIAYTDLVFAEAQLDFRFVLWDKLTLLGGYRTRNGILLGAGWELFDQFRAMYSIQLDRSLLNNSLSGSHELSLFYKLDFDKED